MKIEKAESIIDDMYQKRMREREEKTENGVTIHIGQEIKFTELEEASVIILREELSSKRKLKEKDKIINKMAEQLADDDFCPKEECFTSDKVCEQCIKQYFESKVDAETE